MRRTTLDPYEDRYARRVFGMRSSVMRDLMAITQRPEVISLAGGLPDTGAFDREVLAELVSRISRDDGAAALQYGPTEGIRPVVDVICEVMRHEGMDPDPANIIVTTGGQQVLDLFARTFVDPGDVVIAEGPTYPGVVPCFNAVQADVRHVPLDADGLDPERVEAMLDDLAREGLRAKYLYTIPTFQNPGGCTTSLARRERLVELAHERNLLVLEDNPYSLLRYEGEPLPTLRSLDEHDRVAYLGTFSKIFSPGVRVGWIEAPRPILARINLMKQAADLCSSPFMQLLVTRFFTEGGGDDWKAWVARLSDIYRERRDAMVEAIEEHFPPSVEFTVPQGGLFLWATLPSVVDTTDLLARALEKDVAFVPGAGAFLDGTGTSSMRLNFSAMPPDRIREGIARIGAAISEVLDLARSLGLEEGNPS
ncbi:MAG: putative transcriptional regulator, GntR family [Thermoleophilia bacterium]|nr:putative transcriptional regulator, GntR family [Thermoleophilia bacterium]